MSFVLIITQDQKEEKLLTDAQLITAADWNSLPEKSKVEIIALSASVLQVQDGTPPDTDEKLMEIINSGIPITNGFEEIL